MVMKNLDNVEIKNIAFTGGGDSEIDEFQIHFPFQA